MLKATITVGGDPSVGINDFAFEIPTPLVEGQGVWADLVRMEIRSDLAKFFRELWDSPVGVVFEDECFECGKVMAAGECENQECVEVMDKGVEWND